MALITRLDGSERQLRILEDLLLAAGALTDALEQGNAPDNSADDLAAAIHRARLEGMLYGR